METCAYEDSQNCIWDAQEQGNGLGYSFLDIDGTTFYTDDPTVYDDVWEDAGVSFPYQYVMAEMEGEPYMVIIWEGETTNTEVAKEPKDSQKEELDIGDTIVLDLGVPSPVEEVYMEVPVTIHQPEELAETGVSFTGAVIAVLLICTGITLILRNRGEK